MKHHKLILSLFLGMLFFLPPMAFSADNSIAVYDTDKTNDVYTKKVPHNKDGTRYLAVFQARNSPRAEGEEELPLEAYIGYESIALLFDGADAYSVKILNSNGDVMYNKVIIGANNTVEIDITYFFADDYTLLIEGSKIRGTFTGEFSIGE